MDNHTSCTQQRCIYQQHPDAGAQHNGCCRAQSCDQIAPAIHDVHAALDVGAVPMMKLQYQPCREQPLLETVAVRDLRSVQYYAISHVWRHGRGSTSDVGLYACQLQDISSALRWSHDLDLDKPLSQAPKHDTSGLFWMDSLCIPSDPERRKSAIAQINGIFSEANEVLVIDAGIQLLSRQRDSAESICAAILSSAWQTR